MLNRTIAKFLFYSVAIVLLAWTSSLTYSFLSMAPVSYTHLTIWPPISDGARPTGAASVLR